jgi:integrase
VRFTEANVKAFKPPAGKLNYSLWDESLPGFGFRVQGGGNKIYYAKYRMGSNQRWLKIGAVEKISLAEATKKAKGFFGSVADNIDPANTKAKAVAALSTTFGPAIDVYLEQLKTNKVSDGYYKRNEAHLRRSFKALHTISLNAIDRATVSRELNVIKKRGPVVANRARSILASFFNWAMATGICDSNPVDKSIKNKEQSRDRALTAAELKVLWFGLEDNEYGQIVKLLALTGQRLNEIAGLQWSEVKFAEKQIDLPAHRNKGRREHIIPLSPPALAILKSIKRDGKSLFSKRNNWQYDKDKLDQKLDIPHWVLHDLRRTAKTNMSKFCKVQPHVSEAVLNHKPRGLEAVYNAYEYLDEKRDALDKYAAWIMKVVN